MRATKPILVSLSLCFLLIYSFYNFPSNIIESELDDESFFAFRALRVDDVCKGMNLSQLFTQPDHWLILHKEMIGTEDIISKGPGGHFIAACQVNIIVLALLFRLFAFISFMVSSS